MDWEKYLHKVYYDPKHAGSFLGPQKLYDAIRAEGKVKISLTKIKKWLKSQQTYTLTRAARRKIKRNTVIVVGLDAQWDADLADMANVSKENDGIRFLLVMIDIFSRFLWVRPLKSKKGEDVAEAIRDIFSEGRQPKIVRTDKGQEFRAKVVQAMFQEAGVRHRVTQNQEIKANYAERVIKTLKSRIFRYMLEQGDHRYIDQVQNFATSYNASKHRSLGRPPLEVNVDNESEVRLDQYLLKNKPKHPIKKEIKSEKKKSRKKKNPYKYKIGDQVRMSHARSLFDREYQQKWTGEVFKVRVRYLREGLPIYQLEDLMGDSIEGTMYSAELQPVHIDDNTVYRIDKVLRRRTKEGRKEVLVRWLGWPDKFNTWIEASEVKEFAKS
jgi:transposase InsO family protein